MGRPKGEARGKGEGQVDFHPLAPKGLERLLSSTEGRLLDLTLSLDQARASRPSGSTVGHERRTPLSTKVLGVCARTQGRASSVHAVLGLTQTLAFSDGGLLGAVLIRRRSNCCSTVGKSVPGKGHERSSLCDAKPITLHFAPKCSPCSDR